VRHGLACLAAALLASCTSGEREPGAPWPPAPRDPAPGVAVEESARPGINTRFLSPDLDVDRYVGVFEGESREIARNLDAIVGALGLRPGLRVADVGAGTGLFLEPLSKAVGPEGEVHALDISPRFVEFLESRAAELGLENVAASLCGERDVGLSEGSIDLVFICDTYHHFEYPEQTLASIRRALAPGGSLVVVDFERIPGVSSEWLLDHVRADKATFTAEIVAAGFTFEEELEAGLDENYMIRFGRR